MLMAINVPKQTVGNFERPKFYLTRKRCNLSVANVTFDLVVCERES